jgi:hypothetical protein
LRECAPDDRLRDIRDRCRKIPDIVALLLQETEAASIAPAREHHMTDILTFFSTRTLLQIIFILGATVAMKAWSLGLVFGG